MRIKSMFRKKIVPNWIKSEIWSLLEERDSDSVGGSWAIPTRRIGWWNKSRTGRSQFGDIGTCLLGGSVWGAELRARMRFLWVLCVVLFSLLRIRRQRDKSELKRTDTAGENELWSLTVKSEQKWWVQDARKAKTGLKKSPVFTYLKVPLRPALSKGGRR